MRTSNPKVANGKANQPYKGSPQILCKAATGKNAQTRTVMIAHSQGKSAAPAKSSKAARDRESRVQILSQVRSGSKRAGNNSTWLNTADSAGTTKMLPAKM